MDRIWYGTICAVGGAAICCAAIITDYDILTALGLALTFGGLLVAWRGGRR